MENVNTNNNQEKKSNKKKWILIGAGGAILLVSGILIGRKRGIKIGQESVAAFKHDFGGAKTTSIVTNPIPLPDDVTNLWKKIDEDVFVNLASEIENALCDNCIEDLHLERSWNVADGVVKNLAVTMNTVHTPV